SRLLLAGVLALITSIAVGLGAASVFARRLRRLERSAERIASGDFSEPVVDRGSDEVSELAAAFERMRGRLAQLDDARRAFIANASHELRTPIFALGGFLELLRDEDLDEATTREFVGTMVEQVERLTELAVEDEGGGIPAERLDQVFERFTRLDGARSSGSGLGLAIARELAEAMGGTIRLESAPGRTVFTLVLPAAATADLEAIPA